MDRYISLKVMSFNMKRNYLAFGMNQWLYRTVRIEKIIKEYQPDIIGTQELTRKGLEDMKYILPEYSYVGTGRNGGDKGEHTAIFYLKDKFILNEEHTFWLSATPEKPSRGWFAVFPRICTTCNLSFKEHQNQRLSIFNTHLDHMSYWSRVNSLKLITNKIHEQYVKSSDSILFMGDFNATPTSRTFRKWDQQRELENKIMLTNLYAVNQDVQNGIIGRSYHGFKGSVEGKPIDYIFVSPDIDIEEVKICRDRINEYFPSDHYPIVAKLAWRY